MKSKNFTISNGTTVKSIDDNGELYIEGIANTGERDLVGDVVTENALSEIAEQATKRNLHLNHDIWDLESIIGVITEASVELEGVKIKARILPKFKDTLRELLDEGVRLGLSIAGKAHYVENSFEEIGSWDLTEISLTPVPCDQGTMGTVQISKSLNEFIKSIHPQYKKNDGGNNMADEQPITQDDVIELINTAFSEQKEELLETIRKELEPELEEFNKRIEALEKAAEEKPEEEKPEEEKAGEEEKPEEEEDPEKPKPKPEEEEEDKNIQEVINKAVETAMKKALQKSIGNNTPVFKYSNNKSYKDKDMEKKLTPREIAKMLTGDD